MNKSYSPEKMNWLNPNIEYLFNDEIIEYDMKDAGFNIIKEYHLLPTQKIQELEMMGKGRERNIAVGNIRGHDKEFSKALGEKFAEARKIFITVNDIEDSSIVSVKNDAIFLIGTAKRTKFGNIEFRRKNTYSSYVRLSNIRNLEIYYSSDNIDIKGMGESAVNRHRLYMLSFIKEIISLIEVHDNKVKRRIIRFIDQYKAGELDMEYYIEFNNASRNVDAPFNYRNILIPFVQIISRELR